jgi:outer membrane protein OmpA-like peptidoglycan-associated protein
MKKIIKITLILLFSSLSILGQTKETKLADTYFDNLSFVMAAKEYEKLDNKKTSAYILMKLGDCYYNNVQMKEAVKVYAKLFISFAPEDSEYMFKYAQSLRSIGNFEDSKLWMKKFHEAKKEDSRGKNFTGNEAILSEIRDNKPDYRIQNLSKLNTEYSDFGVTEYKNTILFSSPRALNRFIKRTHTRNARNFLDIFQVNKDKIDTKDSKKPFSKEINSKYHESSVSFSPDNNTIYFTRNNYKKGDYKVDKDGYNKLKIYKAEFIDNNWRNSEELPFCSNEYSVGHPSVSKDGKRLYFTSDMPGSIGKTDIYFVNINTDGSYSTPQNLGTKINTEGREMFPYISEDNTLYFSSDGHFGIGALDVFASKIIKNEFQEPVNLKAPINSELDDFAFSINFATKTGYLSSNRAGGMGDDDIYSVEQIYEDIKETTCNQVVSGIVRDSNFKKHLPFAKLLLQDNLGNTIKDTIADKMGKFSFKLPCNQKFKITASKEYYKSDTKEFETKDEVPVELDLDFSLEITNDFSYNQNNQLIIKINTIYFNYNKWNIRPDAAIELDHIVEIMRKYPKIIVKSTSHTDSRGKESYNKLLSQKRAESTVDYIIYKGISSDRIFGRGYGETQLTNKCIDNDSHSNREKCSEAQHQANRRTSFIILNVDGAKINSQDKQIYQENNLEKAKKEQKAEVKEILTTNTHTVKVGETLYSIATKYGITVERLKKMNGLTNNTLIINQVLIKAPKEAKAKKEQKAEVKEGFNTNTHTVKGGETLYSIATKHGITVEKLKKLNGLTNNNIIINQVLKIK